MNMKEQAIHEKITALETALTESTKQVASRDAEIAKLNSDLSVSRGQLALVLVDREFHTPILN